MDGSSQSLLGGGGVSLGEVLLHLVEVHVTVGVTGILLEELSLLKVLLRGGEATKD